MKATGYKTDHFFLQLFLQENTFAKAALPGQEKLGDLLPVGELCFDCGSIWAPLVLNERVFAPCCFSSSPARQMCGSERGTGWMEGPQHIEGEMWEDRKENQCKRMTRECQKRRERGTAKRETKT